MEVDSQTGSQGDGRRKLIPGPVGMARMLEPIASGFCLCEVPRRSRSGGPGFGLVSKLSGFSGLKGDHIFS